MSYDFDGSGSANLNIATPIAALPFTIACWFKVEADGAGHALLSVGNATDSEMMRLSAQTDIAGDPVRIRATNSGGTNADTSTSTTVVQNTWEHACAVISSTTVRSVYRNGGGKASSSSNSRNITAATRLAIGAAYQAGTYGADTEGKIAHVAVWDIALSDAEVAALASGDNPMTVQPGNLVAYWPLTDDLVDLVSGLTLTNGGGAALSGDNPTVNGPIALTIGDAAQAQTADDMSISVDGGTLTIGDAEQAQSADGVTLDGGYTAPTVSRPAGGGDVDVAATIVTNGTFAWPTIELFGDPESNDNISGTKWEGLYVDVDLKASGRSPVFKIDFSNWRVSTPPSNTKAYWRYASDIGDMAAWAPFDSRSVAGSVLTVWNAGAFTESAIQVANIPPVPYAELEGWLSTWDANAHIFRPAACAALGVSSSAPNTYAYYDFPDLVSPDGIQVGSAYAFAFGITNAAATGPKKRLFHTWTHAGEWGGLRAMLRFAERLMSVADADHDSLRDDFEHVFLIVNTAGMVGGMARGAAESGDVGEDTNRVWGSNAIDRSDVTDPIPSVEASVALLVSEWGVDGDDLLDCMGQVAWHSHTASATKFGTYSTGFSAAESAFLANVEALYGAALHDYGASSTGSSTAFARSGTKGGFALTFEWSYAFADFLNEIGASVDTIGPALVETFGEGWFGSDLGIGDATVAQTADALAITLDAANLVIGDAEQGQSADALTVSLGVAEMVIADAVQGQIADSVTITLDAVNLAIGDAEQGQSADALTVSLGDAELVIADAVQGQSADGLTITLDAANLAIGDAEQGQSADGLTVSLGDAAIIIGDAEQGQSADGVTITLGAVTLAIGDVEQAQTADNVIVLPWVTLAIGDAEQGQSADALGISSGGPDVPPWMTMTRGGRSLTMTRSGRLAA